MRVVEPVLECFNRGASIAKRIAPYLAMYIIIKHRGESWIWIRQQYLFFLLAWQSYY